MTLIVRFASLQVAAALVERTESYPTVKAATAAVEAHAAAHGFTKVKLVDERDMDSVRWTATTPGGRAGRNVAWGDFDPGGDY